MKTLLTTLNSKYVHTNLAIKYLYTVVADEYSDVFVREYTINNDANFVYIDLVGSDYEIICFSVYIWNVEETVRLCEELKTAKPELKILLGGPEVSFDAPNFMKFHPWCDFIICGEGEYPFYRLMELTHQEDMNTEDFATVPGLVYRNDGTIYVNPHNEPMEFEHIPFPYSLMGIDKDRVVYYESTRGCPYQCTYCLSSIDHEVRALGLERVKKELGYFLRSEVKQVKLIDRTFNYNKKRAYDILKYLMENDNGVTSFHMEICAELIDDATVELLKDARKGQFEFEIGIQSTNQATLKIIERNEWASSVLNKAKKLTELDNLHTHVDLIAGLPYEDYISFENSFNEVYELGADALQLGFLKVLKGTKMQEQAVKHGIKFRKHAPYEVIATDYMSAEELVRLHRIENMVDIYYNRGGFEKTMEFLARIYKYGFGGRGAFGLYESLADYYYERGYHLKSRSKEDNYSILYNFIADPDKMGIMNEGLDLIDEDAQKTMDELNYKRFKKKNWRL